uniref:Uncharacterized protein n=1 Tax=Nymphaea colorata TaxID=210225 RepID=A0A5K1FVM0_9MAGN
MVGTVVACSVYFGTAWWLLLSVPNICDAAKNPLWRCPNDAVFFSASVIWGVVGPNRMFGSEGLYVKLNWWFLVGLLAPLPVWALSRAFPEKKWIRLINVPVILGATGSMPPAGAVNYWSWIIVGVVFNIVIYRRYKKWWADHTYVLSAALDIGLAFSGVVIYYALQAWLGPDDSYGVQWWGTLNDSSNCDVASCPTDPAIIVDGCPRFAA